MNEIPNYDNIINDNYKVIIEQKSDRIIIRSGNQKKLKEYPNYKDDDPNYFGFQLKYIDYEELDDLEADLNEIMEDIIDKLTCDITHFAMEGEEDE